MKTEITHKGRRIHLYAEEGYRVLIAPVLEGVSMEIRIPISLNPTYAEWIESNVDFLAEKFDNGQWFLSNEHTDGATKYYSELVSSIDDAIEHISTLGYEIEPFFEEFFEESPEPPIYE